MTLHTKAATEDILDIFNQPLRNVDPMAGPVESDGETDLDDDDYTSAGESTGTGRISGTSEFGDTENEVKTASINVESDPASVSPWSDFTASKHVPGMAGKAKSDASEEDGESQENHGQNTFGVMQKDGEISSPYQEEIGGGSKYVPVPPEDYEPAAICPRDLSSLAQNRLPFMTPIIEKTETSLGGLSIQANRDFFNAKTPSRDIAAATAMPAISGEPLSSPFQEVVNDSRPARMPKLQIGRAKSAQDNDTHTTKPWIKDIQCNPVDESIRTAILDHTQPSLSSQQGYYDCRPNAFTKAGEIRKFIKSLSKARSSEKTTSSLCLPPILHFDHAHSERFIIRQELGKGAFAPVYLAERLSAESEETGNFVAIKSEDPPTAWEFHIMTLLHARLTSAHRASSSLLRAHSLHLYADECYLVEEYRDQGTLLDLVNLAKSDLTSGQSTLDESVAMFFTIELIRTIEAVHSVDMLHGDLKADNCLVRLPHCGSRDDEWDPTYQPDGSGGWSCKGLVLIDFGRSIDMSAFRPDVQFIADWKTGKQDCIEMRELRPWTYQIDYYGMAGVVHSLLCGKYIEDTAVVETRDEGTEDGLLSKKKKKFKIREGLKRYWQTELWGGLFDLLLNPVSHAAGEDNGLMPCRKGLADLRGRMESWLSDEGSRRNGGLKTNLLRLEARLKERRGRR